MEDQEEEGRQVAGLGTYVGSSQLGEPWGAKEKRAAGICSSMANNCNDLWCHFGWGQAPARSNSSSLCSSGTHCRAGKQWRTPASPEDIWSTCHIVLHSGTCITPALTHPMPAGKSQSLRSQCR